MSRYIPKQGDIIKLNFSPSRGKEIQHRRPAVVLSRDEYNNRLGFVIVSPINSTIRSTPNYYTLTGYSTHGQVSTHQMYSLDYSEKAKRSIEYVESMTKSDFLQVMQLVNYNFKPTI